MCGQVRPLLAELLATALFLTLASLGPGPKAISWGVSYALSTLLAGPQAVLNPALSLAMVASRQVTLSHICWKKKTRKHCILNGLAKISGALKFIYFFVCL